MAAIYANSYLTISAVSCQNSLESFLSAAVEPPYCEFTAIPGLTGEHTLVRKSLPAANPPVPLLHRAWAVQERFLSPRVLHFTADDMVFECNHHTVAEGGWLTNDAFNPTMYASIKRHTLWEDIIQHFSQTDITYDTDRLPALSGIAKIFQQCTDDEYVAGLWKSKMVYDLLWQSSGQTAQRPTTYVAPTWSWASTNCAVWGQVGNPEYATKLTVLDVTTQPSTANPLGGISSASLTVQGPIRSFIGHEALPKHGSIAPGQFYRIHFRLESDDDRVAVRLKFDRDQGDDLAGPLNSNRLWLLVCTPASAMGVIGIHNKPAGLLQPHGLVLSCVSDTQPPLYERVGVFQVAYHSMLATAEWTQVGFVDTTVTIL
jgi:hypothetical protein